MALQRLGSRRLCSLLSSTSRLATTSAEVGGGGVPGVARDPAGLCGSLPAVLGGRGVCLAAACSQAVESLVGPSASSPLWRSGTALSISAREYRTSKRSSKYEPDEEQHLVDEKILESNFEEVRVVSSDGTHEVLSVKRALAKSKRSNLNLVVVDQSARPPVCRLMDYSYFKFNQTKKDKERKKPENKPKKRKEVLVGTKISSGHFEMKYNTIIRFLDKKHAVKITAVDARGDNLKETFLQELKAKMESEGYNIPQPVRVDQARKASIIVQPKRS
ncbi:translation initiation factor IF-3 [Chloropicon primus]|uniref:Translation initiation factor IF-3 n=1 Tax=Chloropicon primus TaxID=1764295 RepID=A0A5B8MHL6_9CHLO|nr:translation initiation factor IF-3 [Chloropicon primus]UPQ99340.1 translation initiation factor IF-3 [Chloropicon primus]|mmetsp:Transcript_925/g.2748  ORF Transcript_925/g.2748 Transcript_925/m.2748 type:complete len:275 (-) Transcript_925:63-887(-)|eukprot:QDZ20128.1 translation initiation factor IF-3 [Chloropicon primus]